jgi:hypothetical protein
MSKLFPFVPRHEELWKCNLIVQFQDLFVERTHQFRQHNPKLAIILTIANQVSFDEKKKKRKYKTKNHVWQRTKT